MFQPAAVVNYPNEHPYTRVTEFKYLTGQEHPKTQHGLRISRAPKAIPYYPVPRPENAELYKHTRSWRTRHPDVHFVGRLATYKYYNMDQVVAQALTLFKKLKAEATNEPPKRRALVQAAVGHSSLTSRVEVAKAMRSEDSGDFQADAA